MSHLATRKISVSSVLAWALLLLTATGLVAVIFIAELMPLLILRHESVFWYGMAAALGATLLALIISRATLPVFP